MLSILLVLPVLSMLTIYFLRDPRTILLVALAYSVLSLLQTYYIMLLFDTENASLFQFQEISGLIAIDGISLWLVWLVNMLMPIVILSVYKSVAGVNVIGAESSLALKQILILLIFIAFWSIAVFVVQNILLFYISFEGALVPMYFLIIHYGSLLPNMVSLINATVLFFRRLPLLHHL